MTKIEMMKEQIRWKIESREQEMQEMRKNLEDTLKCSDLYIAEFAVQYAEKFRKAFEDNKLLHEELEMLTALED